jgi:asparagine synthase (glutamine-hydrolysing)
MCGIAGFVDFSSASTQEHLKAMSDSLIHRGPDDDGAEIFSTSKATIGLGFRRLAILDLSPAGHQPMCLTDTGSWIVLQFQGNSKRVGGTWASIQQ